MIYFCPAKSCNTSVSSKEGWKPNIKFCATHGYHLQAKECKYCERTVQLKNSIYCVICGRLLTIVEA
jgi:hypothetical protein